MNEKKQYILSSMNFRKILPYQTEIFKFKAKFIRKILNLLLGESDIAVVIEDEVSQNREMREKMLVSTIATSLDVSKKKAAMLALMASSASLSAARFAHKYKVEREEAIQAAIDFARAGFEAHRTK